MFLKGVFVCAVDCFFPGSVLMLQKVFPGSACLSLAGQFTAPKQVKHPSVKSFPKSKIEQVA